MSVNTNKIVSSNNFSGFQNYTAVSFAASVAGQNLTAGSFIGPIRASTPLNNSNAVCEVQIQYTGLDGFWRELPGVIVDNIPNAASPNYQIETFSYFSGGSLIVDTYISNQTGITVAIPAITFNCRGFLFLAPF